jgi:hypothetical protein
MTLWGLWCSALSPAPKTDWPFGLGLFSFVWSTQTFPNCSALESQGTMGSYKVLETETSKCEIYSKFCTKTRGIQVAFLWQLKIKSYNLMINISYTEDVMLLLKITLFLRYYGLNSGLSPWATPPALFCEGFFKTVSCELFAQAGFKLWPSWSLPPEYLGL